MRVIVTDHARRRLGNPRQQGITIQDLIQAARDIPALIPTATRFRGFMAQSGRLFDVVAKDTEGGRLIITVIGK